jgi:hypothetical protein
LRLGAAGAGLDGHNGVEVISLAGKEGLGLQFRNVAIGSVELAVQLFE